MKTIEDILKRTICIYLFCERIFLEESYVEGVFFSSQNREEKRKIMIKWLEEKGYISCLTSEEAEIINTPVCDVKNSALRKKYNRYEAIEPLLWVVSIINRTSPFDKYVTNDFSKLLQIGPAHNINNLISISTLRKGIEIITKREVAMLWHWRSKIRLISDDIDKIVLNIFGKDYKKYLKMKMSSTNPKDFIAFDKPFHELSTENVARLEDIVLWRHHAYEWVLSDEDWDSVPISL